MNPSATGRALGARAAPVLRIGFVVAAVAAGAAYVAGHRDEVTSALRDLGAVGIGGAAVPALAALLAAMLATRAVLRDLGNDLPVAAAGKVFFVSQVGKYLPGSVWPVVAQAEISRRYGVPRRTSLTASTVALLLSVVVGLLVAAACLVVAAPDVVRQYWWALAAAVPLGALLHPAVLGAAVDRALRLVRRPPLVRRPTAGGLLRAAGWTAAGWVLLGLHVWVLAVAAGAPRLEALPVAVGGFALAFCAGVLVVPAPAGAGVRDVVVVLALGSVLSTGAALTVAVVSRVLLAACDVGLALTWGGLRVPARAASGTPTPGPDGGDRP